MQATMSTGGYAASAVQCYELGPVLGQDATWTCMYAVQCYELGLVCMHANM
jgi:hypothetical protein